MPTQQIANPYNAFAPSQGPATGPDAQQGTYLELPNQDTVPLIPGTFVAIQVVGGVTVGVIRSGDSAQSNTNIGICTNYAAVGAVANVCVQGIVKANIGSNAVTAGNFLMANISNTPVKGTVDDTGETTAGLIADQIGNLIFFALTAGAAAATCWVYIP